MVKRGLQKMANICQLQNMNSKCQPWDLTNLLMEATVDKCLAFCQALVSSNQTFTFTLSIGKETFKFDNRELAASSWVNKKKKSPCQIRREEKRREARKPKVAEEVAVVSACPAPQKPKTAENNAVSQQESTKLALKCEQCDYTSTSEKGLKQHTRMKHRISEVDGADDVDEVNSHPTCPPGTCVCKEPRPGYTRNVPFDRQFKHCQGCLGGPGKGCMFTGCRKLCKCCPRCKVPGTSWCLWPRCYFGKSDFMWDSVR